MSRRGPAGPARLLCIDKPAGPTSFEVVRQVRRVSGQRRVGHGGTLDPFATGLLVVGLGPATRLLGLLTGGRKVYHATACFGVETDSGDPTGAVVDRRPVTFTVADLERQLPRFTGIQSQVPPRLSAIRVEGRRSYDRVRAGEDFELTARDVHVYGFELLDAELPRASFRITCSGGTYIRSLARDLGRALGCCAHLEALRRERVGEFSLDEAVALERLAERWDDGRVTCAPVEIARGWPRLVLDPERAAAVRCGRQPETEWWTQAGWDEVPPRVALVDTAGELVAVAEGDGSRRLSLVTVLPPPPDAVGAPHPPDAATLPTGPGEVER